VFSGLADLRHLVLRLRNGCRLRSAA
jgi:hypothetical protein